MSMTRARQHGFTLIELIIFIVVVGAGMAGILSLMNTVIKSSADPLVRKQTIAIAESLLEEILLRDYPDATRLVSPGCTNREKKIHLPSTDIVGSADVCDYQDFTSSGILDVEGVAVLGLENYKVTSTKVNGTTLDGVAVFSVQVSVKGLGGETITLTGYRAADPQ